MVKNAENSIKSISPDWSKITLVSGGAALSDHIAVQLYLNHPECKLVLHFPCKWDTIQFHDNGQYHWSKNPGKTANTYHRQFTNKIGINSLSQIQQAISAGAQITEYNGFHERNLVVGCVDHLIAFGFDDGLGPTDGGTSHTWRNSAAKDKIYCQI